MRRIAATYISIVLLCVCANVCAQEAQNRPYIDTKPYHLGFQVGVNFLDLGVTDSNIPVYGDDGNKQILHVRMSGLTPGFHVGFIADVRLNKYFNFRFCPGLQFSSRTLSYVCEDTTIVVSCPTPKFGNQFTFYCLPINFPVYLKFSAMREGNYRPYVIAGGGVSLNVYHNKDESARALDVKTFDAFCEIGFGVDLYFRWFKWCPEITYRIGFVNQLIPSKENGNIAPSAQFYTDAIASGQIDRGLMNHCICLTFNFE